MKPVLFIALSVLLCAANSSAVPENEVLVLLDNLAVRETHSIFFKNLNGEFSFSMTCPAFLTVLIFRARLQVDLQAC